MTVKILLVISLAAAEFLKWQRDKGQMSNFKLAAVDFITKGFLVSKFIGENINKCENYGLVRRYALLFGY